MNEVKEYIKGFFRNVKSDSDFTEQFFIKQLESMNKCKVWAALEALEDIGTIESIDALKKCALRPIQDAQISSLYVLRKIIGNDIADFAASLLENSKYREKRTAMIHCCEVCNEDYRQIIEKHLKKATSRYRACLDTDRYICDTTVVLHYLLYLKRINQPIGKVRALLLSRRDKLTNNEIIAVENAP